MIVGTISQRRLWTKYVNKEKSEEEPKLCILYNESKPHESIKSFLRARASNHISKRIGVLYLRNEIWLYYITFKNLSVHQIHHHWPLFVITSLTPAFHSFQEFLGYFANPKTTTWLSNILICISRENIFEKISGTLFVCKIFQIKDSKLQNCQTFGS